MKKLLSLFFLWVGMLLFVPSLRAQEGPVRSNEITTIGGKEYYLHHVKRGQTLWELSRVYNVTIEEIELMNPEVKKGLKAGHVLGIPVRPPKETANSEPVAAPENPKEEPNESPQAEPLEEPEPIELPIEEPVEEPVKEPTVEIVEEPEIEPVVEPVEDPVTEPVEEPEPETEKLQPRKELYTTSGRVVQAGEDLYDIAKEFGIDISDFKMANPGLSDEPAVGTVVRVPAIANENDYIVHFCEKNERVTSLLKRWKVDESVFRAKNVSVGSHVFVNQVVLIPIQPITDFYWMQQEPQIEEDELVEVPTPEKVQPVLQEQPQLDFDMTLEDVPVCIAAPENALKRYRVALMVPLFLQDIGSIEVSKENVAKAQKSRSLSFLQFYEGFMLAAETMENQGMKLDLTVIDVTDNVSSAEKALSEIRDKELDLIIGPFFGKSFAVVEDYAKANGIAVVNPLSNRESVIEDNPNVIKVKPGDMGMILSISNMVKNAYSDANVFIVSYEKDADTAFLNRLEHHLNLAVNDEVTITGDEFLQFARNESKRLEMGSRMVQTLDVEGQVYSTADFQNGVTDKVVLANPVKRYAYSDIGEVKSQLSGVRTNLIIAYGDDNVFATQMLNSLTKDADRFPITLVGAPDWSKFEKLLVDNLLKMNAIYVSDFFVDYQSEMAKRFVLRFRDKYVCEPQKYAFEGYDVGCYFLSALMQYGSDDLIGCLHCYEASLLHTKYRFYYKNYLKSGGDYGKENLYWSIYQYDNENIELVPIDPFKKVGEEE